MNLNESFGQLRALMNRPTWGDIQREELWVLAHRAHQQSPQEYIAQWVPYITGFAHHLHEPLMPWTTLVQLNQARALLPMACWALALDANEFWKVMRAQHPPGRVTSLALVGGQLGRRGAQALADSVLLSDLTALAFQRNQLGRQSAYALANSEYLSGLVWLDLEYNELGDSGVQSLSESERLSGLKCLNLVYNQIGVRGAKALADSEHLSGLTSLNLKNNQIGVQGARALAKSEHLSGLSSLNLEGNEIGAKGAQALANAPYFTESIRAQFRKFASNLP